MAQAQGWLKTQGFADAGHNEKFCAWFAATFDGAPGQEGWRGWPGLRVTVPQWVIQQKDADLEVVVLGENLEQLQVNHVAFERWYAGLTPSDAPSMPGLVQQTWAEAPGDFLQRIRQAQTLLGDGFQKVVLANCRHHHFDRQPGAAVLSKLIDSEATGIHFAYGYGDGAVFAGCTPETLVRQHDDALEVQVLAGTRPRSGEPDLDRAVMAELLESTKDRTEHDLVAQGIREALEPMVDCVEMSEQPRIRSLPQLHHLERYVTGRAHPTTGFFDLVHGLHPTPALGGYPRHHALAYLEDCEPLVRGGFGAPFGWVGSSRQGHAAVAIRAALLRGDTASVYAGAGIVADSDPDAERAEVGAKIHAIEAQLFGMSP
jgi:isochorismate synthase